MMLAIVNASSLASFLRDSHYFCFPITVVGSWTIISQSLYIYMMVVMFYKVSTHRLVCKVVEEWKRKLMFVFIKPSSLGCLALGGG